MKQTIVTILVFFGYGQGFYFVFKGYKKLKKTGDDSFRLISLFSNKPFSSYSGIESIFFGTLELLFAIYITKILLFGR